MGFLCSKENQGEILLAKTSGSSNQLKAAAPGEEYGPDVMVSQTDFNGEVRRMSLDERKELN